MAIHHAQIRQAEQYGFTLEERPPHVRAFHPSTATQIFGVSAKDAIAQMLAFLNIHSKDPDVRFNTSPDEVRLGWLRRGDAWWNTEPSTPVDLYRNFDSAEWKIDAFLEGAKSDTGYMGGAYGGDEPQPTGETVDRIEDTFEPDPHPKDPPVDATPVIARSGNGVPLDGAIAYKEGIMAGDNPFPEGSPEGDIWDSQWDQAADEAPGPAEKRTGTVVASRYRTKYAEEGHPNHCGDWLAELLNNFCVGDKHTDLETFERICAMNGVDTSKYNRTTNGWQGRIRMTGRNLLAKVVFDKGQIVVPNAEMESGEQVITAPADWMASRPYKAKENAAS